MSDDLVIIRFPNGDAEFDARMSRLSVGDRITRRGAEWLVARVDEAAGRVAVTVMPAEVQRDESWPTPYQPASAANL